MAQILIGIFIILHGLVHLWYVTLALGLVAFQTEMGWNGQSWLLSNLIPDNVVRLIAGLLYGLATIPFVFSGIGVAIRADWWTPLLIGSAIFSSVIIILFWDGTTQQLVEKGLLGLVINIMIITAVLLLT